MLTFGGNNGKGSNVKRGWFAAGVAAALVLGGAGAAQAGHGSSAKQVASAIASGSSDAIAAELEHAEYLVCAACVDYVMPLVDNADPKVRQVAAWWLARRGVVRQVFTDMLWRLSQPDSLKARNAADVLGELKSPAAIPALGAALSNPIFNGEARAAMARALGSIGRGDARPALETALGDSEPAVRAAALMALGTLPDVGTSAPAAMPLLGDSDEGVRIQAIYLVGRMHARDAATGLVQLVASDPSAGVRKRAAWALGEVGAPAAVAGATLNQAAASDPSPLVRSLASAALSRLTR